MAKKTTTKVSKKKKKKNKALLSLKVRGGKKARKRAHKFLKQFDVLGLL